MSPKSSSAIDLGWPPTRTRTSSSAETLTTAPRTRSTAWTTGVRRFWLGRSSARGRAARTGAGTASADRMQRESAWRPRTALLLVVVLEVVLSVHRRLDRQGLVGEVREGLQILLVVLLVDDALAQVTRSGAAIDELVLDLGHVWGSFRRRRESSRRLAAASSACYRQRHVAVRPQ